MSIFLNFFDSIWYVFNFILIVSNTVLPKKIECPVNILYINIPNEYISDEKSILISSKKYSGAKEQISPS